MNRLPHVLTIACLIWVTNAAAPPTNAQQPAASRSILIMTGRNMIPVYGEPRVEQVWFDYSSSFAEALRTALGREDVSAQLYVNKDRDANVSEEAARLLGQQSHAAIIQVHVAHVKNTSENTVYLEVEFLKVRYATEDGRRSVTFNDSQKKKYPILGEKGKDMRDLSSSQLADQFVKELKAAGAI